jgi:hypothetical protein
MPPIYLPAIGPADWPRLLAAPEKHWKIGYSARALAHCWHAADGFPPEVRAAFAASAHPALHRLDPLIMLPEHQVMLPGRGRASQTDLWVLARNDRETVSIAVEGKVDEPFGPTVGAWLTDASAGRRTRLSGLCSLLGLANEPPPNIRYQLLHRTASALIEARRFHVRAAVLLIHSFSPRSMWHADYAAFAALFGAAGTLGALEDVGERQGIRLFLGWVPGDTQFLEA